jgi:hypothetical protein
MCGSSSHATESSSWQRSLDPIWVLNHPFEIFDRCKFANVSQLTDDCSIGLARLYELSNMSKLRRRTYSWRSPFW